MNRRTHLKLFVQDCKDWLSKKIAKSARQKERRARKRIYWRHRRADEPDERHRVGRPPYL